MGQSKKFSAFLLILFALGGVGFQATICAQEGQQISMLGVPSGSQGPGGDTPRPSPQSSPAASPSPTASPAASGCATAERLEELRRILHPGGQKTALIIRGGKYGIHRYHQAMLGRLAEACSGDTQMQAFLNDTFRRDYLSDDVAMRAKLENAGYRVEFKASSQYAGNGTRMKEDVMTILRRPETTVVLFYGHAGTDGMVLMDVRENSVPGPREIQDALRGRHGEGSSLDLADLRAALGTRKLDALIIQGCTGGLDVYKKEKLGANVTECYTDYVRADTGFFSGWCTFATYFTPQTGPIVDAFFCHALNGPRASPTDRRRSSRYFKRTGGFLRQMSTIAGLVDAECAGAADLARIDADADVHEHNEDSVPGAEGIRHLVQLVYDLKRGNGTLVADIRRFMIGYNAYLVRNRVPIQRGQQPPPALGQNPTVADINRQLAYHMHPIMSEGLDALVPGLVVLRQGTVTLNAGDQNKVHVHLNLEIRNSTHIADLVRIIRNVYEDEVRQQIDTSVPGGIGPQLAERLRAALTAVMNRVPSTILTLRMDLTLEKVVRAAGNQFRPLVEGYNLSVGSVPAALRNSAESPYEIHVGLATVTSLTRAFMNRMFGSEIELTTSVAGVNVYAYLTMWSFGNITRISADTLEVSIRWQVRVNYGIFGDGYGYFSTRVRVRATPGNDLRVTLTPTVWVTLEDGWPGPAWLHSVVSDYVSAYATRRVREEVQNGLDFGTMIPADARGEILGRVRIHRIVITPQNTLSVYINHVQ